MCPCNCCVAPLFICVTLESKVTSTVPVINDDYDEEDPDDDLDI